MIQQALNNLDCNKMPTEILLFYCREGRDSNSTGVLVDRVKNATQIPRKIGR